MKNILLKTLITVIENHYNTGAIGHSLYKEIILLLRELQVTV